MGSWNLPPAYKVENETMAASVSTKEKVEELKQDSEIKKALAVNPNLAEAYFVR